LQEEQSKLTETQEETAEEGEVEKQQRLRALWEEQSRLRQKGGGELVNSFLRQQLLISSGSGEAADLHVGDGNRRSGDAEGGGRGGSEGSDGAHAEDGAPAGVQQVLHLSPPVGGEGGEGRFGGQGDVQEGVGGGGVLEGGGVGRNVRGGREDGGYENGGGQRDGKGGGGDGGGGEGGEGEWGGREEGVEWAEACQRALDEEELLALYEVCGLGCKV